MMCNFRQGRCRRLGRKYFAAAIDLKGVGVNDLRVDCLSDIGGDLRFSRRGRTDNEENIFHLVGTHLRGVRRILKRKSRTARKSVPTIKQKTGRRAFASSPGSELSTTNLAADVRSFSRRSRSACGRGIPYRTIRP